MQARNQLVVDVGDRREVLEIVIGDLNVELRLRRELPAAAAPQSPLATPGAVVVGLGVVEGDRVAIGTSHSDVVLVSPAAHQEQREGVRELGIDANLGGEVFPVRVVTGDRLDATPTSGVADAGHHVRSVAVDGVEVLDVRVTAVRRDTVDGKPGLVEAEVAFFDRHTCGEAVAGVVGVRDLVGVVRAVRDDVVVVDDVDGVIGEGREVGVRLTDPEAAQFEVGVLDDVIEEHRARRAVHEGRRVFVEERAVLVARGVLHVERQVGAQRAEFGLGPRIDAELEARTLVPGVVEVGRAVVVERVLLVEDIRKAPGTTVHVERDTIGVDAGDAVVANAVACADVVTDVAADLQAGFGAGDVVEAGAVYVANANVFDRLRLGSDDRIGGARTGDCDQGRSGAEKKALDVHFLTSSQSYGRPGSPWLPAGLPELSRCALGLTGIRLP